MTPAAAYVPARVGETPITKHRVRFLAYVQRNKSKSCYRGYEEALERFFRVYPDLKTPEALSRLDVADYKLVLKRKLAPNTQRLEIGKLTAFWDWMIEFDLAPINPWRPMAVRFR